MIRYFTFSLLVMLAASGSLVAQEIFVNASVNGYVPLGSTGKTMFPVLHYDKDSEPGFIMGGFAIGGSYFKSHSDNMTFKAQANLVRYKYWDEPKKLRAESNEPLGAGIFHSVNYSLTLSGVAQYYLSERFSIGAGLGLHGKLASQMKARNEDIFGGEMKLTNSHYKRIMPVVPVELSLKYEKMFYTIRYEQALLNRLRGDLASEKSETFGLIYFEVGRPIR